MQKPADQQLEGRARARLSRAREYGCLNATGASPELKQSFFFWCWRLRIPALWFERNSRASKYGRVSLDLFTTACLLTESGRNQLAALGDRFGVVSTPSLSAHECSWDRVPIARIEEFARAVYRTATRMGACTLRQRAPSGELARMLAAIGGLPARRKSA
jgi:hypothetical protein